MNTEKKYTDARSLRSLQETYGAPAFYNEKTGQLKRLNEHYWAARFARTTNVIFQEGCFWQYDGRSGLWRKIGEPALMNQMLRAIIRRHEQFAEKVTTSFLRDVLTQWKGQPVNREMVPPSCPFIHVQNGVLEFQNGEWQLLPFSPDYFSRNQLPVSFDPGARYERFLNELLLTAMTEDDVQTLKQYMGQCLLGRNISQTFLILSGTPGGGKGTLVNVIEQLIGRDNSVELRTNCLTGRFEVGRYLGKKLLIGRDVPPDFLQRAGAQKLKSLTGNDTLTAEFKGENSIEVVIGEFNVIIVSNSRLLLRFESDEEAWRRRLLVINYERPPLPTEKRIDQFDKVLMATEGSGILNFALAGAAELLSQNRQILRSEEQMKKAESLLMSSDPVSYFISNYVELDPDSNLTVELMVRKFRDFSQSCKWPLASERKIQSRIKEMMFELYGIMQSKNISYEGRAVRGYVGCRFVKKHHASG